MEIRFIKGTDVPAVLSLLKQVGALHHQGRPDIFRRKAQKYGPSQVFSMVDSSQNPILIAAEDEQVLGYCFCEIKEYKNDPVMADRKELYIDDLCVDKTCRGQGVGSALYEAACKLAKEKACHNVSLNVWCCNETAVAFYNKLGLKPQKIGMEMILEED